MSEGASALVLFSGGQDSTTCLAWALERFGRVETVGFTYRQTHAAEMTARPELRSMLRTLFPRWADRLGTDHVLSLDVLAEIGGTALTGDTPMATRPDGVPNTFVPGRNLLFFTAAAALAVRRDIHDLVGGMCETDYSGYPDCRDESIKAMGRALNLGMGTAVTIHTPLMHLDKAATWALAERLGGATLVDVIVEETVTCYRGDRAHRHDWGYGCSACPACELRARGYDRYRSGAAP